MSRYPPSDNIVEQHSLTHFPIQPWELDVVEWKCVGNCVGTELAQNLQLEF